VYAQTGEGPVPLPGATVTLKQSFDEAGPFAAVPNESTVMSPANRTNPDTTNADGMFGWDVLAGYYTIEASKSGCDSQTTPALDVPPPVSNLELTLTCLSPPTRSATSASVSSSLPTSTYGQAVTFTAQVGEGTSPAGIVTFDDDGTPIGEGVLENGEATLTLGTLTPGAHSITVSYSGDGANRPASSTAITQTVTGLGASKETSKEEPGGGGGSSGAGGSSGGSGGGSNGNGLKGGSPAGEGSPALVSRRISVTPVRPTAAVALRCVGGQLPCAGTLKLTVSEKVGKGRRKISKPETIATASFSIAAGKSETLELHLDPAGVALLRKGRGQLRANLTLSAPSASPPGPTTVDVLLIRQKPKSKRH
jgi:Bacterial Ig-like domain (group 3)